MCKNSYASIKSQGYIASANSLTPTLHMQCVQRRLRLRLRLRLTPLFLIHFVNS
jgi:hypothetical protein